MSLRHVRAGSLASAGPCWHGNPPLMAVPLGVLQAAKVTQPPEPPCLPSASLSPLSICKPFVPGAGLDNRVLCHRHQLWLLKLVHCWSNFLKAALDSSPAFYKCQKILLSSVKWEMYSVHQWTVAHFFFFFNLLTALTHIHNNMSIMLSCLHNVPVFAV